MVAPRVSFFDRWSRGTKTLGTRLSTSQLILVPGASVSLVNDILRQVARKCSQLKYVSDWSKTCHVLWVNSQTRWVTIMPNRPVRDQWEYPRKIFPIKPGQPIGKALATFYSFSKFLIRAKNRFVKNGTANFGRNIPTETSGPHPEVIPNIQVKRSRNGPFQISCPLHSRPHSPVRSS